MDLIHLVKTATVTELGKGIKNKAFSSVELTSACLKRAKSLNKKTNAFITIDEEGALEAAKKADEQISNGSGRPLTGIPIAVKDNISTKNA